MSDYFLDATTISNTVGTKSQIIVLLNEYIRYTK